jgi:hypothetical protein
LDLQFFLQCDTVRTAAVVAAACSLNVNRQQRSEAGASSASSLL